MSDKVLISIYDYPRGDMADLEVRLALRQHLPGWSLESTSVPSFKTLATGFAVSQAAGSQLAQSLAPDNVIIYANCAPRKDQDDERSNNAGEGLAYAELHSGVKILIVNSYYSLSFVRDDIASLHTVLVSAEGSQFRSRDNFPPVLRDVATGNKKAFCGEALDPQLHVPEIPELRIAYIDSFGNLKLTLRQQDPFFQSLKEGSQVRVKIGRTPRVATVSNGSFNVKEGELALAPGSSGYDNRFVELFLRGGSAQQHLHAEVEDEVKIQAL